MSWIYSTLTYTPAMNVSGYDLVKLYVSDSLNASSAVVTIQFVIMKLPCQNDGSCQQKNGSNYPCTSTHRAESFDMYYDCVCLPGYSGVYCEGNVDECLSSPCQEPYECVDGINMYACRCPADEPYCDFQVWIIPVIVLSFLLIVTMIIVVVCVKKRFRMKDYRLDHPTEQMAPVLKKGHSLKGIELVQESDMGVNNESFVQPESDVGVNNQSFDQPESDVGVNNQSFVQPESDMGVNNETFVQPEDKAEIVAEQTEMSTIQDHISTDSKPNVATESV